jgi:hypothetical protein
MTTTTWGSRQWGWVVVGAICAGCNSGEAFSAPDSGASACGIDASTVHGLTADGRVNVTASEAWPGRPTVPPLTAIEVLSACAKLAACFNFPPPDGGTTDADKAAVDGMRSCVDPSTHIFEERAIPEIGQNERWTYKVRTIVASAGCSGVLVGTKLPTGIVCQEDGCWWGDPKLPTTSCQGDVATLTTDKGSFTRDCSHSYTTCSTTSGTGCTDRPRVACESSGNDRCDGDVKLGCDRCGLVSFHDCGAMGGHCMENPGGAACVYPDAGQCAKTDSPTCAGNVLTLCVGGTPTSLDCVALGLKGCANGHCTN